MTVQLSVSYNTLWLLFVDWFDKFKTGAQYGMWENQIKNIEKIKLKTSYQKCNQNLNKSYSNIVKA